MLTQPWVYYIKAFTNLNAVQEQAYLQQLSPIKSARIQRLAFAEDRTRSILGLSLLRFILREQLDIKLDLQHIQYRKQVKPFIKAAYNTPNIDFNITHSGSYVACAVACNCRVGLDTEMIQDKTHALSKRFMSQTEISYIGDNEWRFLEIWTKKEALIKADPEGKLMQLKTINVMPESATNTTQKYTIGRINNREYYLYKIDLSPDVVTHIACENPVNTVNIKSIDSKKLIQHDLNF